MSFLFDKKTRNAMRFVWIIASVMIILSMVLVFSGGSQGAFAPVPTPQTQNTGEDDFVNAEDIIINAETESGEPTELEVTPIPVSEIEGSAETESTFEADI